MLALENVRFENADGSLSAAFDCHFTPGRIGVVLGTNRSGKSDLCRFIAGLPSRYSGSVRYGADALSQSMRRQRAAMVYQAFINYPHLTVLDNIASPLRAAGAGRAAARREAAAFAEMLGLGGMTLRLPHELSGGQQQRVAIARALAKGAPILLLDEPLVNLDYKLREELEGELREILRARGTLAVYTSSDPRDAFAMADDMLLLHSGELLQQGAPLELYRRPANQAAMALLSDPQINCLVRDGMRYYVRPEQVSLARDAAAATCVLMVVGSESNGAHSLIHGSVDGLEWVVRVPGVTHFEAGSSVPLLIQPADLVAFHG